MITVQELVAEVRLEPDDFERMMARLVELGRRPAAYEARRQFWEIVRDGEGKPDDEPTLPPSNTNGMGDIFFPSDEDVLFLLARGPQLAQERQQVLYYVEEGDEVSLRIGLFTSRAEGASQRLAEFASDLENAIRQAVDGRKTRHMSFDWQKPHETNPLINQLSEGAGDEADGLRFAPATLSAESIRGSEALADPPVRGVLIQVSQARVAQASDLWKGQPPKRRERIEQALEKLDDAALVEVNQLIQCPQANDPLMQLRDPTEVEAIQGILHPACGKTYGEHDLVPAYSVSDLGYELIRGSHWMTVWVTKRLVDLGVPLQEIVWTLASGPEEIDIALSFLGELWIFELKDREFGVGDALPFNYRHRVRYKAEQAVVITTERVSPDARRVLDEMADQAKHVSRGTFWTLTEDSDIPAPILIEGLDKASAELSSCFDEAAAKAADRQLKKLEGGTGFPVAAAVRARLGQPEPKPRA